MDVKLFEVRDAGTFIPVMAVRLSPRIETERYLLGRSGYGTTAEKQATYVVLTRLAGGTGKATCDPFEWFDGSRTMHVAHQHIIEHWSALESGAVVDVEFILGLRTAPKQSEAVTVGDDERGGGT